MEALIKEINLEKIKFVPVKQNNLLLSLDRLTRFKYPKIKYYRVFSELLCRYLIEPKLSKQMIESLDINLLKKLVEKIWNESVKKYLPGSTTDYYLNNLLKEELFATYNLSDEIKSLIDINLNIDGVLDLIDNSQEQPINIKRLLAVRKSKENVITLRNEYGLRFPVEKVVLTEGITEEILLPVFSKLAGYDFDKNGVKLISAGGKNQVAKLYCELKDELKIPVFILLDADAVETSQNIHKVLRSQDSIYLIKHGEFEDIFSLNLIKRTINKRFKNICESTIADFKRNEPMTRVLSEFFRLHELGDFQKADFAKELAENAKYDTDLTEEILLILEEIKQK